MLRSSEAGQGASCWRVSQPNALQPDATHVEDRSLLSRGTSRNKGLESGPGMAGLGGAKKTGLGQLPQTPVTISLAVLQVHVRELCLDTSDDTKLTTNQSNT